MWKGVIPKRGLRQGCPILPYLFLLCAKGLSAMIKAAELDGILHGIPVARRAPTASHLFFADDSNIFGKANLGDCQTIVRILNSYMLWLQVK